MVRNKCLNETRISEVKREITSSKEDLQPLKQESVLENLYPPMSMYSNGFPQPYSYSPQCEGGYMNRLIRPKGQGRRILARGHAYFVNHQAFV